jgi:hypothetical protein
VWAACCPRPRWAAWLSTVAGAVHGPPALGPESAGGVPWKGKVESLQIRQPHQRTHSLKTTRAYVNIIDAYHEPPQPAANLSQLNSG